MNSPNQNQPGVKLNSESVAGEEDPGASMDVTAAIKANQVAVAQMTGASNPPAGGGIRQPSGAQAPMSPGDDAPPGTPGTGENVCPGCGGSGQQAGSECAQCQGTGKVTVGIGGA